VAIFILPLILNLLNISVLYGLSVESNSPCHPSAVLIHNKSISVVDLRGVKIHYLQNGQTKTYTFPHFWLLPGADTKIIFGVDTNTTEDEANTVLGAPEYFFTIICDVFPPPNR
jgi:hypothetical protein